MKCKRRQIVYCNECRAQDVAIVNTTRPATTASGACRDTTGRRPTVPLTTVSRARVLPAATVFNFSMVKSLVLTVRLDTQVQDVLHTRPFNSLLLSHSDLPSTCQSGARVATHVKIILR